MEEHKLQLLVLKKKKKIKKIIVIAYESRRTQTVTTPSHIKIKGKKSWQIP
jgi:hypothetical protein